MKKVILLGLLMIGFIGLAQNERGEQRYRENLEDLSPEQMATLQTKRMTLTLDLTEAQQKQLQKINLEQATSRKERMMEMKAKKESGGMTKPTSEERYAIQTAKMDQKIAQKAKMKQIFSKEQYEKWEKMHHRKGHHKSQRKHGSKEHHRSKN
ncbi:MAG: protein CpxP [Psychroserpens sp.]|jgi:protein CpxP